MRDREQVLLEADKNGTTTARYALGRMVYGDLVSQYRSAATSYYHYDALGQASATVGGRRTLSLLA